MTSNVERAEIGFPTFWGHNWAISKPLRAEALKTCTRVVQRFLEPPRFAPECISMHATTCCLSHRLKNLKVFQQGLKTGSNVVLLWFFDLVSPPMFWLLLLLKMMVIPQFIFAPVFVFYCILLHFTVVIHLEPFVEKGKDGTSVL